LFVVVAVVFVFIAIVVVVDYVVVDDVVDVVVVADNVVVDAADIVGVNVTIANTDKYDACSDAHASARCIRSYCKCCC
jgi:hypothetical protein